MGQYHSKDLVSAVEKGKVKKVKRILKSTGTQFEQTCNQDGMTPLQVASRNGQLDIVEILIRNGYGTNTPDGSCWFPAHHACAGGHVDILKLLTSADLESRKADVDNHCVVDSCKCAKQTALHVACAQGYYNCVVILLTLGADLSLRDKNGKTAYDIAVKNKRRDIAEFMKPFLSTVKGN